MQHPRGIITTCPLKCLIWKKKSNLKSQPGVAYRHRKFLSHCLKWTTGSESKRTPCVPLIAKWNSRRGVSADPQPRRITDTRAPRYLSDSARGKPEAPRGEAGGARRGEARWIGARVGSAEGVVSFSMVREGERRIEGGREGDGERRSVGGG